MFGEDRWGLDRDAWGERFHTRFRPDAIGLLRRDRRLPGFELRMGTSLIREPVETIQDVVAAIDR